MTWLAGTIVVLTGLWLIGLGASCVVAPARTRRFLHAFASSARAHYTEQSIRLIAGAGFVGHAAQMRWPTVIAIFGWILVATALVLLLLPWRWHRRFATWAIPLAVQHLRLFAVGAFALGVFVLYSAWPWWTHTDV